MSSISQPAVQVTVQPTDATMQVAVADGAAGWINADFSAQVPATAKTIEVLAYHPDALQKTLGVRANGSAIASLYQFGQQHEAVVFTVAVDTSGIIEVYRTNAGGTFTYYVLMRYTL